MYRRVKIEIEMWATINDDELFECVESIHKKNLFKLRDVEVVQYKLTGEYISDSLP